MTKTSLLFFVELLCVYLTEQAIFFDRAYIDSINKIATTWEAGVNFDPKTSKETILGLIRSRSYKLVNISNIIVKTHDFDYRWRYKTPNYFDARRHWRQCSTIGSVRDQGKCGTCWAFSTAGAFEDRLCIATDGLFNMHLSVQQLLTCCHTCGHGCKGGKPIFAWEYFRKHGIVTGGDYNSGEGCQPYKIKPCIHTNGGRRSCFRQRDPPKFRCVNYCYGDNTINFEDDRKITKNSYYLAPHIIQEDVVMYGPVTASFDVYDDFFHYKKGVYQKTRFAKYIGRHDAKLIGWGIERGIPYWLMVNSWNTLWGDHGLFKIRRGRNECKVESSVTGGIPLI